MPKGRILAVDDQRYFRELLEGLLSEEGYEVQTASSGEDALRILEHSAFDMVVTDLVMPVMSGTDLVQRIKDRWPDQEIVVVTGVVDVKSAVDAMKVGATDYILKPFDRETLCDLARRRSSTNHRVCSRTRSIAGREHRVHGGALASSSKRTWRSSPSLSLEALGQRPSWKGLCHETGAQGALHVAGRPINARGDPEPVCGARPGASRRG